MASEKYHSLPRHRAKSSGLKCLEQITQLFDGSHLARFAFTKSTHHVRFYDSSHRDNHRHKTVWYEAQYPLVRFLCCYIPLQHIWLTFFRTTFAAFPARTSKCVKYSIIVFLILRHIRTTAHASLTLGREP